MTEVKFVNAYVETIVKKTNESSCGWFKKTAEACQQRFKQLMLDWKEELNRRGTERKGSVGIHVVCFKMPLWSGTVGLSKTPIFLLLHPSSLDLPHTNLCLLSQNIVVYTVRGFNHNLKHGNYLGIRIST